MKRALSILLAAVLLLGMTAFSGASAALAEGPAASALLIETPQLPQSDEDTQIALIFSKLDSLKQKDSADITWYYAVTDLDHNGRLEFIAAAQHPADRSTNLKVWEVSEDRKELAECVINKDPEESFPDILTESADTFHDKTNDVWAYLCYDNIVLSDTEVYTNKCSYCLKDGRISYDTYSFEHTVVRDGYRYVTHTDADGLDITPLEYDGSGVIAFEGDERSSTGFDWFRAEDAAAASRLADSYAVFTGSRVPSDVFPVPKPAALQKPAASPTPAPAATPAPTYTPVYLTITKNPTSESKAPGGTAYFVACANAFDSLAWTMVSPDGREYAVESFAHMFADAPVSGIYSTTLSIGNVAWDMNGWGAYCTFWYGGQVARTSTAYLWVNRDPAPTPKPQGGVCYGTVSDWTYSTVSISLNIGSYVSVSRDICSVSGSLYYGAPATVYWDGYIGQNVNITYCTIEGQPDPEPQYGAMNGTAHEGGGGFAIDLVNGVQVFVDAWRCNVIGTFYDGCSCTVYYTGYPSNNNIYQADIYGYNGYEDKGGWAGSQYYNNEDQGGWAGSHYYDNEDQGGWAGSHYYDNETGNSVPTDYGYMPTHISYNPDGSTYEAIWCPICGTEVSLAMEYCPGCGCHF